LAIENYRKIEEKASKILKLHQKSSFVDDALYMLAVSYSRIGEYTKAEQSFKEFFAVFPNSKLTNRAKSEYGIMLYNLGKFSDAMDYLTKTNDKTSDFYLMLIYYKFGNYGKAMEIANKISNDKKFKENLEFKTTLAYIYVQTNKIDSAERIIDEISKLGNIHDSTRIRLYTELSDAYLKNKNYEKAISSINKITYKDSTSLAFSIKLRTARIFLLKGDTSKAMDIFEYLSNISFDSTKFWSYYYLANIYENKNEFERALEFYEKAYSGGIKVANERKEIILKLKAMKDEKDHRKLYKLAETFYIELNKPQLALEILDKIINETSDKKLKEKALLFAIYISSKSLYDKEKASNYYSKLENQEYLDIAKKWIE
ncbi:MAG: tetratricopeptide repeat protein, partial [candidate division WOR-3 bacterium]|nr:tetratricopeptide repeat protein [candidate division WOR-3 bacterium]MDW8151175.1 tetratricopeptide repeat protein [candidate division WOR-3 bacterium]